MSADKRSQRRRRRTSVWSPDVERRIKALGVETDLSALSIRTGLVDEGFSDEEIPSKRAIEYRLADLRPPDPTAPWSFAQAKPNEAAAVLPVLGAILEVSDGRTRQITNELAQWIVRVRAVAADLPPLNAYHVARWYRNLTLRDESTEVLDQLLALAPWRDASRWSASRIVELVPAAGEFPPSLVIPMTPPELRAIRETVQTRAPTDQKKAQAARERLAKARQNKAKRRSTPRKAGKK